MPLTRVDSLDDPRLDVYRDLPQSQAARAQGRFVAEGMVLVDRLLDSDHPVETVLLEDKYLSKYQHQSDSVELIVVPDGLVEQILGFKFHRGVLACAVRPPAAELDALAGPSECLLVVCIGVCDQENLGAIIRNVAAFGGSGLILDSTCCDPFARRVVRVSMGTNVKVPIRESDDLAEDLRQLSHEFGVQMVATTLDDAVPLHVAKKPAKAALLLGNEGYGLDERWLALADQRVTVPMQLETDSLNVAVFSGIALYAWRFQQV